MSIGVLKKENNPDIIDIVSLYITNMQGLNAEGGYENANRILDLIDQKRIRINNLLKKMIDEGISREFNVEKKDNYVQLNKLETMIRTTLEDSIRKSITNPDTGRLDANKFEENFAVFLEDEEIKQLCRNAIDSSKNTEGKKVFSRLNRGNIESDDNSVGKLVEKMVDRILEDYEPYEEYIYTCKTPIDLEKVYTNLNSYFLAQITDMQRFALKRGTSAPIR